MINASSAGAGRVSATRCWTLHTADGAIDVQVTARDDDRLAAVLPGLAALLGVDAPRLWWGSTLLSPDLPLSAPELAHGAVLGGELPGPRPSADAPGGALELRITGGPDAGRTVALDRGRHVLGRGAEATIVVRDPDVSRRHAAMEVGNGELTVADLGSSNGSRLDDAELTQLPRAWPIGAALRLGSTTATVSGPGAPPSTLEPGTGGRTVVRPAHRLTMAHPDVDVAFPRRPDSPSHRKLPWAAAALPAVGGGVMAVLLHTPTFLFFAVLSPLVALGSWLSDRWSGRRDSRRKAAAHELARLAAVERLDAALRADLRALEVDHPDLATLSTAVRRRSSPLWSRHRNDIDALTVRLGAGPGPSRVVRVDGDGRAREQHEHRPVTLDLTVSGGLGVVGPRPCVLAVLAGLLAQLTALHAPGEVDLLLLTDAERLPDWRWTRWLPHVHPGGPAWRDDQVGDVLETALRRRLLSAPEDRGWLVVVVDRALDAGQAARLRAAREARVLVLTGGPAPGSLPVAAGAVLSATGEVGETATLVRDGSEPTTPFVVDRVLPDTAAAFARTLAALEPARTDTRLPDQVRLLDVLGSGLRPDAAAGALTGQWIRDRASLYATIGRTEQGRLEIDLCRHGPHALVAGTTGSGKSELLQTLITTLALNHPPDRCSFLLVDYKGGAAFAEAAALPHTVGVLTDLDGRTTARALRSLGAELTRRETVLAEHGVADLSDLPDEVELARLVIVVDEFATLADELPGFVPGLVAIAQRGRSLGVHLILATQRPSGVVSPEIRANCTLRICLRTTDEADSRDVLGSPVAAHLPLDLPGRAFVRLGSGAPVAVQIASISNPAPAEDGPAVLRWRWPQWPGRGGAERAPAGRADLARLVAMIAGHAAGSGLPTPHRPWLPPLPDRLAAEDLPRTADRRVPIGLVDRPGTQSQEPLEVDLDRGGGWLAIGGPRSGRTTVLRTVLAGAVGTIRPDDLHVHVIDHGGGALAAEAGRLPHAGTCVGAEDSLRTVRLLDRLADEVAARRSGARPPESPRLLLLVDGVESLMTQLDECDPAQGAAALLRLVRDGAAVGLTCLLTADRAVPGNRLSAVACQRLVLPLSDRADYAVAGVPAAAVPTHRPPGRALLGDDAVECQLAVAAGDLLAGCLPVGAVRTSGPLRIADLPPDPVLGRAGPPWDGPDGPDGPKVPDGPGAGALRVAIGPGGDEGHILCVDFHRSGGLLVIGPPDSGRSALLDALAGDLASSGRPLLRVDRTRTSRDRTPDGVRWIDPRDGDAAQAWLADVASADAVVIADDVGAAPDWPVLAQLSAAGPSRAPALIAAGTAADLIGHYQGPLAALRRARSGLLLCPGPAEADVLGIRLPRTPVPLRPGSGWLIEGGRMTRVQVARRRNAESSCPARGAADPVPAAAP